MSKTTMDLRINSVTAPLSGAGSLRRATSVAPEGGAQEQGFYTEFKSALKSVSASQNYSTALQREVQLENPNVSLEETMLAMQKAQIGFQASLHVRNRLVQAYTDIMNMQV
jgi:flagellar hook-basal body complex protein FliE